MEFKNRGKNKKKRIASVLILWTHTGGRGGDEGNGNRMGSSGKGEGKERGQPRNVQVLKSNDVGCMSPVVSKGNPVTLELRGAL